jgi:hypothetical protein
MNRHHMPDHDTSSASCVLAIEPDAKQALVLEQVLSGRIGGKLLVVASAEAALQALVDTIPDLVLVSPLLAPRTEDQFLAHLRALGVDASHLQILSIPRFGNNDELKKKGPFRLNSLKKLAGGAPPVCDPVAFANEVAAYLEQVSDTRQDGAASSAEGTRQDEPEEAFGVRIEHIERLLERLRADSTETADNSTPQVDVVEEAPSETLPGKHAMPMQTAQEVHGGATRDANSGKLPRFLTLDEHISASLRALLDEADGCLKMSFFTGGAACVGRALDLLLSEQGISAGDRAQQIQEIGKKHPAVADSFLRVLSQVLNDQSGTWDASRLNLTVALLKAIAYEIYVLGPERTERATYVIGLLERFNSAGKGGSAA